MENSTYFIAQDIFESENYAEALIVNLTGFRIVALKVHLYDQCFRIARLLTKIMSHFLPICRP